MEERSELQFFLDSTVKVEEPEIKTFSGFDNLSDD